ncbi:hypothetical protein L211DRAFT_441243 [Terfezia boudieri ATCC MYA-4762]|uniref:Uncharacterized protein n=1 Tax=Terfezia boudieri ATCC MYA-4762 TaxID=1051890 RepID=A0A3N4LHY3_9PEZI|nr:hypothetical protein L211DRAFT_441243 [Terfezia boudieri ATCC MYA-4762]
MHPVLTSTPSHLLQWTPIHLQQPPSRSLHSPHQRPNLLSSSQTPRHTPPRLRPCQPHAHLSRNQSHHRRQPCCNLKNSLVEVSASADFLFGCLCCRTQICDVNLKRSSRYCCYEVFIPKSSPPTGLPIMNYTMTNPYETQRVALSFRMQSGVVLAVGRPSRRG